MSSVAPPRSGSCISNVLFWNIHGQNTNLIGNKFADTEFLNVCRDFDVLGIAELHTNSKPSIKGFKLVKDKIRPKTHSGPKISGGLAVFAKKEIAHMIKYVPNSHEDSIWVKFSKDVTGEGKDIFLDTCYISPPKRNKKGSNSLLDEKHSSLEKFFEEANQFSLKGEVIMQGDMNGRIGSLPDFINKDKYDDLFGIENHEYNPPRNSEDKKVCDRGSLIIDLCKSGDYRVANGRKPGDIFGKFTSMQWNGSSVVDYVITQSSNLKRVVEFKIGKFLPCLSDHCPLQYKLKLNTNTIVIDETGVDMRELPAKCKWNGTTKTTFLEALKTEKVQKSFEKLENEDLPPESGVSLISSLLLDCANCNPSAVAATEDNASKMKGKNPNSKPWYDKECTNTKKKINTTAMQLKRNPTDARLRETLYVTKRSYKNLIKKKKVKYKQDIIDQMHITKPSDKKQFWKLLNKLDLDSMNTKNAASEISPKEWMNHYTNLLQGTTQGTIPKNTAELGPLDYEITDDEILKAKGILKPGKATGVDIVNNEMVLEALREYPQAFRKVMNSLLREGIGAISWLVSLLVPIHKKGPTDDPDNYRGIALISCLAKFFYAILNNRLLAFCLENEILSPSQLGFLAGNRTSDAHIVLYNLINDYCHRRNLKIFGCFVDFSKAFDSIPRDRMFQKLLDIGITGKFYDILKFMYEGDQVCIKLNNFITPAIKTIMGVRQGCVLSPLLFNIYMSDFPKSLSQDIGVCINDNLRINCILWADDIILFSETEEGLNTLLSELKTYSDLNHLKINTDKTKCMIFNKTGRLIRRNFFLGTKRLENVRCYKYLGLMITPSGEIRTALDDLRSRALKAYMALKNKLGISFRDHVDDTIGLFDSLVKPILLYGSDFWGCLKQPKNNPIENLHMQFCRQILGVQRNTTNSGVLLELGRTPLLLEARRLSIKNWERIKDQKGNFLVTNSYENQWEQSWSKQIEKLLSAHGMHYKIPENASNTGNAFFGRTKDIFIQEALCGITNPDAKLRTYGLIKHKFEREEYLVQIRNTKHRQTLSKFRLSNHKLMIEVGRHMKVPKEDRICEVCKNGVEDEIHFLIKCQLYEAGREPLFELCAGLRPQFRYYSDQEKFIFLMTSPFLMGNVSKFIASSLKERDIYLDSKATLDCLINKVSKLVQ